VSGRKIGVSSFFPSKKRTDTIYPDTIYPTLRKKELTPFTPRKKELTPFTPFTHSVLAILFIVEVLYVLAFTAGSAYVDAPRWGERQEEAVPYGNLYRLSDSHSSRTRSRTPSNPRL
jgi:hypothetical protein